MNAAAARASLLAAAALLLHLLAPCKVQPPGGRLARPGPLKWRSATDEPMLRSGQGRAAASGCDMPVYAYVADMEAYRTYLNPGFYELLAILSAVHGWRRLAAGRLLNTTKWDDITPAGGGCMPDVIMFVIKFHWEFVHLSHLGPKPTSLQNTTM